MAIFKQKEFSSPSTKVIFRTKQAGNAVKSALKLAPKKSNVRVAREAIQLRKNLPAAIKGRALDTAIGVVKKAETFKYYPGRAVDSALEGILSRPAGVAAYGATAMLPVPSSLIAIGVETGARQHPGYNKLTSRLVEGYQKSGIPEKLKRITGYGFI